MLFQVFNAIFVCFLVFTTGKCEDNIAFSKNIPPEWHENLSADEENKYLRMQNGNCKDLGESLPDLTDCTAFWVCDDLTSPAQYFCPTGEFFDPNTNRCDANYTCIPNQFCSAQGEKLPNPFDCASYYLCDSVLNAILIMCGEGHLYDQVSQNCMADDVECYGRPGCLYAGQTIPDMEDCTGFYVCDVNKVPKHYYCRNNINFDSITYQCLGASAMCAVSPPITTVQPKP